MLGDIWLGKHMRKGWLRCCICILGVLAILGTVVSVPAGFANAFASKNFDMAAMAMAGSEDCPKQVDPCPDCLSKICPDAGSCLVGCVNSLPSPLANNYARVAVLKEGLSLLSAPRPAGTLSPPLIRPPIV